MIKSKKIWLNLLLGLALCVATFFIWGNTRDRLQFKNWNVPAVYQGDDVLILGWLVAAREGDFIPFHNTWIHRLDAPYTGNWNDYPMYEKFLIYLMGQLTKVMGLIPAYNAGIYLCHATAALTFFACARFLRIRREWAFAVALLFGLTHYQLDCNMGGQLFRSFVYPLPFAMLVTWLILASKRIQWWDASCWICLITSLVMGFSNPYNLNMWVQLLGWSVIFHWFMARRKANLQIGVICLGIAGVAFISVHLNTLIYGWLHGKNSEGMFRHYMESELYSLKPMELFIPPPTHHWSLFAKIGNLYNQEAFVRGEMFSPYLGLAAMAGLAWFAIEAMLAIVRFRRNRVPAPAVQSVWVLLYATLGGINCILGLAGILYFRSSNRYSIFISTFALLFLASRMSRLSLRWSRFASYLVAGVILVIGLVDQLPAQTAPEQTARLAARVANDENFCHAMEARLPDAAMVFELPVMVFPEALPTGTLTGYEMFVPYIYTKHLHISFGAVRGRTREEWQWEVEKMPAPQMIATLEKYGFSAIYVSRRGYDDHGDQMVKKLTDAGCQVVCEDEMKDQVCFALKPSATPELPHTDDRAQVVLKSGWVIKEHNALENRQWSDGNASFTFFSEPHDFTTYNLRCVVGSVSNRRVSIEVNGREVWSSQIGNGQGAPVDVNLNAHHGQNLVKLITDAPPAEVNGARMPLAFTVVNLQITKLP